MELATLKEQPETASEATPPASVLVVDDNSMLLEMLQALLTQWGYDCVTASDGLDALVKLAEHRVRLVLTDYQMPNLNGLELLARLRERYPRLPVMILSSDRTPQHLAEARRNGAVDWVDKPVEPARLRRLIATALQEGGLF